VDFHRLFGYVYLALLLYCLVCDLRRATLDVLGELDEPASAAPEMNEGRLTGWFFSTSLSTILLY